MILASFEIDLQALLDLPKTSLTFREPPRFPVSEKDYSILLPKDRPFGRLEEILNGFSHPAILTRTYLFGYEGTGELANLRSFTFRFSLCKPDGTLTGEEINAFHNEFLTFLAKHNLRIREA
jgi:phenylalanyl-tRNA synthetase beta subunit